MHTRPFAPGSFGESVQPVNRRKIDVKVWACIQGVSKLNRKTWPATRDARTEVCPLAPALAEQKVVLTAGRAALGPLLLLEFARLIGQLIHALEALRLTLPRELQPRLLALQRGLALQPQATRFFRPLLSFLRVFFKNWPISFFQQVALVSGHAYPRAK